MEQINSYINKVFVEQDEVLEGVLTAINEKGMRPISVSPASGKLLTMLVAMTGAEKVLEIGALGGYSGICLARGFGAKGHLTSLELEQDYAELANTQLIKAGFDGQVNYLTGTALESLAKLKDQGRTFDFFFIDADKENYENYLVACLELAENGALIVADNVLAGGSVAEAGKERQHTEAMQKFNETAARHPQLESILLPVGDGLLVSRVKK
ncbi:O-methyltransferase [Planococcus sp. CP5-4]|uniref:O-methyltransferase n=1 Tax=unclassified Planococcus (in: firmicutes) TaxID=2662419 RepID=UPI001C22DFE0|nr:MULTISPECIES: O-methyltransferase [unclassified Planococcus (in: firmicutes)]MBU9672399.1 O-methyltransferase [Planococcus sp. CP5-4_YE]MBV0909450.1 O-methyltransferase [Planococcus sp. CP5-4_UN]MBW6064179.1 O-methyltransferase [Planococcus sp. CP5-4]